MKTDLLRKPLVNDNFMNHTVMYPGHHDEVNQARRQIQERVIHKHRTDSERQHTNERNQIQRERRRNFQELERSDYDSYYSPNIQSARDSSVAERPYWEHDVNRSHSSMAKIYSSPIGSPRPPYYSPMQSPRPPRYSRPTPSPLQANQYQSHDYENMSEENKELYEKLNSLKMADIKAQRTSKGSYSQKFREKTEAYRRSQNSSRVSMQSGSNVSSRNNSGRVRHIGEMNGNMVNGRVQISRDSTSSYKVGSHVNTFGSRQGSHSQPRSLPNGNVINTDVLDREYEVTEPVDLNVHFVKEIKKSKDQVTKVRNTEGPIQVHIGKDDLKKLKAKQNMENEITASQNNRKRVPVENSPITHIERMPISSQYVAQNDFRYEIPEVAQANDAEVRMRAKVRNSGVTEQNSDYNGGITQDIQSRIDKQYERDAPDYEKMEEQLRKLTQPKTNTSGKSKNDKKNAFAFGSTLKPPEKSAKKSPTTEKQTSQTETPQVKENDERSNISRRTKGRLSDERAIANDSDDSNSAKERTKPEPKPQKDSTKVKKNEKLARTIADETKTTESAQKPKKGILRKTSSFKVIGSSSNYFGYMSISQGMAVDKKVVKRVRYHDSDTETNTTRPISA